VKVGHRQALPSNTPALTQSWGVCFYTSTNALSLVELFAATHPSAFPPKNKNLRKHPVNPS